MDIKYFHLPISNILFEWKTLPKSEILSVGGEELQRAKEAAINAFPKVLAIGPDCKTIKPGHYISLNPGIGIQYAEIDGNHYGMVKEHQVAVAFDKCPENISMGEPDQIKTTKTEGRVKKFQEKASETDLDMN